MKDYPHHRKGVKKMEIKVLGAGCSKCTQTVELIQKVLEDHKIDASLEKVTDMMEIVNYGVMRTPAVVVDGKVKIVGKVPSEKELVALLCQN